MAPGWPWKPEMVNFAGNVVFPQVFLGFRALLAPIRRLLEAPESILTIEYKAVFMAPGWPWNPEMVNFAGNVVFP